MTSLSASVLAPDQLAEHRFFELSIDMLCYARFDGFFQHLNPAWQDVLGYSIAELQAEPMIGFVHPDDRGRTLAMNREVRAGGQAVHFENRYRCKDGSYRWLLWNAVADLERETIYSVARDITARKEAEEERDRLVVELRSALAEVKSLQDILPICSYCRSVRDDDNYWQSVEAYVATHTETRFSHGICPSCFTSEVEPLLKELGGK